MSKRIHLGRDSRVLIRANIELLAELGSIVDDQGRPAHPRLGEVGIVDGTRLFAPVEQAGPRSGGYLASLRRPGMELVDFSTYKRGDQYDTVIGWKLMPICDQSTMLPLVWSVAPGNADERGVLFTELLPLLFELWPDCPMHTLVGDSLYDTEATCRDLERLYSIHPVFTRDKPRETEAEAKGGRRVKVVDGQPFCGCPGGMKFRGREGFYEARHRLADGRPRGEPPPEKRGEPRIRWICPNGLHEEVSLWVAMNPRDFTWWPRGGDSEDAHKRRALELYRSVVESMFAVLKQNGIGVRDGRPLWARDNGITWLIGLHFLWRTAQRLAHESGNYEFFREEFVDLGFAPGSAPTAAVMDAVAMHRPAHLRWSWPGPRRQ
jgi:hypothetical protein